METQDQAAAERADRCIEAMSSSDRCTYCDGEFDPAPHVDAVHRFTPLCGVCYGDEHRRAVTARRLSDDLTMDEKIKSVYGKTPSEMSAEECRVAIADIRALAAYLDT